MNADTAEHYYPNILGRIILQAMEEILGIGGLNAMLDQANLSGLIQNYPPGNMKRELPYSQISKMMASLEANYGQRPGQGLAVRTGRACFKYGLREVGQQNMLSNQNFRLLPLNTKIREGARLLADFFSQYTEQRAWFEEDDQHFYWHTDNCPLCWQRQADDPVCHLAVGTLQEALYWVSGGKLYRVEEMSCIAKGDPACIIRTDKRPFE